MQEQHSITDFLKTYGTLMLATYGVIQVWLIALWKRLFRNGTLTVFKTGQIELGYSNYGPTIALSGTLRAEHKDVFVSEISIGLVKERDSSVHKFEWAAFRSIQLPLYANDKVSIELPSSFNVRVHQPHRYHIFFSDRTVQAELSPMLNQVRTDWQRYVAGRYEELLSAPQLGQSSPDVLLRQWHDADFSRSSESYNRAWDMLQRKNYWESGNYTLTLLMKTSPGKKEYQQKWSFTINNAQSEDLRLNSIATLQELCVGTLGYHFAYVEYL